MATNSEDTQSAVHGWRRRGMTTILLEQRNDGQWRATRGGVAVEGIGDTATQTVAHYCRHIEAQED